MTENRNTSPKQSAWATLLKYGGVSFTQTFVELGAFALLQIVAPTSAANAVAVVISATYQFLMNRNVTFKSTSSFPRSVALFVLLWVWNLAFSTFMVTTAADALSLSPTLAKLVSMCCQAVWGYLLSKHVIFR